MSCGVVHRCGSDPALLWLWRRLAASAPIRPLAWELPHAEGAALEKARDEQKKKRIYSSEPWPPLSDPFPSLTNWWWSDLNWHNPPILHALFNQFATLWIWVLPFIMKTFSGRKVCRAIFLDDAGALGPLVGAGTAKDEPNLRPREAVWAEEK